MPNQNNNEESEIFPNWQRKIRENLEWYRDGEKDHGDLVIAEESIITEVKNEIFQAEQRGRREVLEQVISIIDNSQRRMFEPKGDGHEYIDTCELYKKIHKLMP